MTVSNQFHSALRAARVALWELASNDDTCVLGASARFSATVRAINRADGLANVAVALDPSSQAGETVAGLRALIASAHEAGVAARQAARAASVLRLATEIKAERAARRMAGAR